MAQNLFTEAELAKVTDEEERKHLIECAQDQSKIDLQYMKIMDKYDLWEKGSRSRYFHATTHENAEVFEAHDHNEAFFDCKAYMYMDDIPTAKIVKISRFSTEQEDDKE